MLKVGLIGCGFMGTMHANCYKALEGVTLAAVADIRPEKAAQLADGAEIFGDGKELIEQADVDIIDICLPIFTPNTHCSLWKRFATSLSKSRSPSPSPKASC